MAATLEVDRTAGAMERGAVHDEVKADAPVARSAAARQTARRACRCRRGGGRDPRRGVGCEYADMRRAGWSVDVSFGCAAGGTAACGVGRGRASRVVRRRWWCAGVVRLAHVHSGTEATGHGRGWWGCGERSAAERGRRGERRNRRTPTPTLLARAWKGGGGVPPQATHHLEGELSRLRFPGGQGPGGAALARSRFSMWRLRTDPSSRRIRLPQRVPLTVSSAAKRILEFVRGIAKSRATLLLFARTAGPLRL